MDTPLFQVQTLGQFTIGQDGERVRVSGRSRKLCLLLAVLIHERARPVPWGELAELLWPGEPRDPRSLNALKAILHRARVCLAALEDEAGQPLILNREGCFQWNPCVPLTVDGEEFSRLCRGAETDGERGVEALALYRGDFLPMLAGCPWADAIAGALRQEYAQAVPAALSLLEEQGRWPEAARAAEAALALDPCREDLCARQMEALLRLERRQEAARVYEAFQDRLLSQTGALPSDGLRALCRKARQERDPARLTPDTLLERLEETPGPGALLCDFDFFRVLCHSAARRADREDAPVHTALLSLSGPRDVPLPRRSLDRAMDNLQGVAVSQLRQGDAVARYGASQFVILLPRASLADSRMVCQRIIRAFTRQFPHSPAALSASVLPLAPPKTP